VTEGTNFQTERFSPDATQKKRREARYKKTARKPKRPVEPNDPRPRITLRANDIERIVDEAEAALLKADRGLYQRDGKLVSVERVPAVAAHGQRLRVQRICERGERALQEDLSSAATFEKWDARSDKFVATDPPMTIVKTLQERRGRLRFPVLAGVVSAPTMRPDGSLLTEPGYDAKTGLLFDPLGVRFPVMPDQPTRGDAEQALTVLGELIPGFPFVKPQHRAVALSAILTATVRHSLPAAPLHAYTAPVAGSGKTKLLDIASVIATGSEAPVTAPGKDEEELEKRLVSSLLAGDQIIGIDNCSRPIGGDLLCQIVNGHRRGTPGLH
jgi:putative DNA primase/helicase